MRARSLRLSRRCPGRSTAAMLVLSVAVAGILLGCHGGTSDRRSLVLVTLDTTRADRIGVYGGTAVPTPNLDRIATEGVVVEQAISQVPLTLPAHATMITGRYPATHGVRYNGVYRLPDGETTLAEVLRDAGYETAAFVAAYVLNRGFGTEQGLETYDDIPVNRFAGGEDQIFEAQRTADEVNARVFDWLEKRHGGRPFFLWVHYYDPHDPYEAPETPGRDLSGSGYDREISYLDACFGDLMDRLGSEGMLDESLLVVVGDHGESLGEHGEERHGMFLYEGAVHVPMFFRAPGLLAAGGSIRGPAELVDLVPTILDLLGAAPIEGVQGRSLRSELAGTGVDEASLAHAETLAPRLEFGWSALRMVRDGKYKYVQAPKPELYDLESDPGEQVNLVESDPDRAARMAAAVAEWKARTAEAATGEDTSRELTREERDRLRALGYLAADASEPLHEDEGRERPDPKDRIAEVVRLTEARDHLFGGDPAKALPVVEEMLRESPGNLQARTTQIRALIDLKRYDEAAAAATAYVEEAQNDPDASGVLVARGRGFLASVYRLQGKDKEAEEQYRAILESDPAFSAAYVDLARLLIEQSRLDEARSLLDGVLERDPKQGMALAARFLLEQKAGDTEAALRTATALADARTGDPPVLAEAGRLLLEKGDPRRAAVCLSEALERSGPENALMRELGVAQMRSGQPAEARQTFIALSRVAPRDPRPHFYLGMIALEEGNESEARQRFEVALRLDPTSTRPMLAMARWLAGQGREDEAREILEEAVRRRPNDPRARQALQELLGG